MVVEPGQHKGVMPEISGLIGPPSQFAASHSTSDIVYERLGSEWEQAMPYQNLAVLEYNAAHFIASFSLGIPDGLAYGIYSFNVEPIEGGASVWLSWQDAPMAEDCWVGLANWPRDCWDWFPSEPMPLEVSSLDPYADGISPMLVAIMVCNYPCALWHTQVTTAGTQPLEFTNLFFLHHSTGEGVVQVGDVRGHVATYNSDNGTDLEFWDHGYNEDGLRDPDNIETGESYAIPGNNTDPDGLHYLWTSGEADAVACRDRILNNHQVIAFKSCFPASAITSEDMLDQYKAWYLEMRDFFDTRLDRVFVVMSPPPLCPESTNLSEAKKARRFADWLKSDEYLLGHPNVACFDLFDVLAHADDRSVIANMLHEDYVRGGGNSHPNDDGYIAAGAAFAPFMCETAISYTAP
jgi:hypothetical protein